jgi:hypothetical protein
MLLSRNQPRDLKGAAAAALELEKDINYLRARGATILRLFLIFGSIWTLYIAHSDDSSMKTILAILVRTHAVRSVQTIM